MKHAPILRLFPAAALALSIAGCAKCPYPQTQPAPVPAGSQLPGTRPPAPLEPSRVEPGDNQVVVETDTQRVIGVEIRTLENGASGQFAPTVVRARRGDLLRFSMADGDSHHNVSFASFNRDKPGVRLPPESPYLTEPGQSWQLRVDLAPGTYEFACVPHAEAHRGRLIVEP
ncbi:cupredoxin domain-containing protein [Longimicrobium sp.]|uniref:cupredoxin domain-containing protein n=1 Tax=Longimicrobium sp. TaxID=2029185 RepID=UPI003B3A9884